jgi:hypothetical protein
MKGQLNHLPSSDFIESNPMPLEGSTTWTLEDGTDITVGFEYQRTFGVIYVNEISHNAKGNVTDQELREAVMNTLGPCEFEDTEIVRN